MGALIAFFADESRRPGRLVGCSAGALVATLVAAGFEGRDLGCLVWDDEDDRPAFSAFLDLATSEVEENPAYAPLFGPDEETAEISAQEREAEKGWMDTFEPESIVDDLGGVADFARGLRAFYRYGAVYAGCSLLVWLEKTLRDRLAGFSTSTTLADFAALPDTRPISLVASDTTAKRRLVLDASTAPDCPLLWAVRMSMSIPFLWNEVRWQASWGLYTDPWNGERLDLAGHFVVDGGLVSNFPLDLVVPGGILHREDDDEALLGLFIDETLSVRDRRGRELRPEPASKEEGGPRMQAAKRAMRILDTMLTARDRTFISRHDEAIVKLPAAGYGTTRFQMSRAEMDALIWSGYAATRAHFGEDAAPDDPGLAGLSTREGGSGQ